MWNGLVVNYVGRVQEGTWHPVQWFGSICVQTIMEVCDTEAKAMSGFSFTDNTY